MELYTLLEKAKNNDKRAIYEIIQDFNPTLKKLSNSLYYEEAETNLIIELLLFIENINLNKFINSTHKQIAKYIHMHLKKRALDLLKKHKKKHDESIGINLDTLIDKSISDMENTVLISILISSLVKEQRKVITMKYIDNLSEKEIAKILGITRQAVNRVKNRALKNLRKILIKDGGEFNGKKTNRISCYTRNMDNIVNNSNILYFEKSGEKRYSSRRKRGELSKYHN